MNNVPDLYRIAKVVKSHGIKGTLKVTLDTDFPERLSALKTVFIGKSPEKAIEQKVIKAKASPEYGLVDLEHVMDRNMSDALVGSYLYIPKDELHVLPDTLIYVHDLISMRVYDDEDNDIGKVTDVFQMPSSDMYEVELTGEKYKGKRFLVPVVDEFIRYVDREKRIVHIHVMEGLFD